MTMRNSNSILTYHTKNTEHTNMYGKWPDIIDFYCQQSGVASYPDLAMSAVTMRCQKSFCQEQ